MEKIDLQEFASELNRLFPVQEGEMNVLYGHIGSGKTALGTLMALQDLMNGQAVYLNWKLNWQGYDERKNLPSLIKGILGLKKRFYVLPKENLHYIEIDEDFIGKFKKLTDCRVYLDEGHIAFDSYQMAKMKMRDRKAVLSTRHFDRAITVISQRPTAIHATIRGNVNRYYKCERIGFPPFMWFRRSEIQDTDTSDRPDEEKILHKKYYYAWSSWLNLYDSKYLRGNTPVSQLTHIQGYSLTYKERFTLLKKNFAEALKGFRILGRKKRTNLAETKATLFDEISPD